MVAKQAKLGRTLQARQKCQGGQGGLEVRETILMKPERKLPQISFGKHMHNPLYNEAQARALEKKRIKNLHFHFLEDLGGLQCPMTKNQRAWIEMFPHLRCYCQIIKRHNNEGGSFSRLNSQSSLHTVSLHCIFLVKNYCHSTSWNIEIVEMLEIQKSTFIPHFFPLSSPCTQFLIKLCFIFEISFEFISFSPCPLPTPQSYHLLPSLLQWLTLVSDRVGTLQMLV